MVADGKPIIGAVPVLGNVLVAAGHGMLGLSMAPATGKLVTEMLRGRRRTSIQGRLRRRGFDEPP